MSNKHDLIIKEDEFSWQGTLDSDGFFYIRRVKKPNVCVFSDLNVGSLASDDFSELLISFLDRTPNIRSSPVIVSNISPSKFEEPAINVKYDAIVDVISRSLKAMGFSVTGAQLAKEVDRYDAIINIKFEHEIWSE